jgi:endonuclease/exonuclease/phosphatase family metal-dependent hydrolase
VTLRVLTYNIRYGGIGKESELSDVIRAADPHVVMLQESTDKGVVERVAAASGCPYWGCQPRQSTGFLSRIPVSHFAWHRPRAARHPFLEVVLSHSGTRLFGLHLSAWFSKWSERRRAIEIRALLDGIRHHQHGFHMIAGDFNALAPGERLDVARMPRWIRAMIWVSGRDIARDTIQVMLDEQYVDGWRLRHPDGPGWTFPVWDPHVRLDYVFLPGRYSDRLRTCEVLTHPDVAKTASDHFPLLFEVDEV